MVLSWELDPLKSRYVLQVIASDSTGTGGDSSTENEWTLNRRYSQFDELKNCLAKTFPLTKKLKFPPKVMMGNLQPKVIAERTEQLALWMNELLMHQDAAVSSADDLLSFLEASPTTVKVGSPAPTITVTDIQGRTISTDGWSDQLVVYSAASRYNFQKLTEFLKPAQAEIIKTHPNLSCQFVSVADLRVVPDAAKSMVEPILKKLEAKDARLMEHDYMKMHSSEYSGMEGYFIPDYNGDVLKAVNCNDANWTFRTYACIRGKVVISLQSSMQGLHEKYVTAIQSVIKEYPQIAAPLPGDQTVIREGDEKIPARRRFIVDVPIKASCTLAWMYKGTLPSRYYYLVSLFTDRFASAFVTFNNSCLIKYNCKDYYVLPRGQKM